MRISEAKFARLCNFVGYGRLAAPVWFIGLEEGGGSEEGLLARVHFDQVMDCAEAHCRLDIRHFHDGPSPRLQRTWAAMCSVMLELTGDVNEDRDTIRRYQAEQLGSADGATLLAELLPLPKKSVRDWPYPNLLPRLCLGKYYEEVWPHRRSLLRGLLAAHQPRLVVCYGKSGWDKFKELFPGVSRFKVLLRSEKGTLVEYATQDGRTVLLTHHFSATSMSRKELRKAVANSGIVLN
jgi:hypothetical protein